jgi:hypothetical protein
MTKGYTPIKGIGFDHREISKDIRTGLKSANKTINTAERFGNKQAYNAAETKLKHARDDINSIKPYRVSRTSALRHAIGFSRRGGGYMVVSEGVKAADVHSGRLTTMGKIYRTKAEAERLRARTGGGGRIIKIHPANCNCPFHGGHKKGQSPALKGIGQPKGYGFDLTPRPAFK